MARTRLRDYPSMRKAGNIPPPGAFGKPSPGIPTAPRGGTDIITAGKVSGGAIAPIDDRIRRAESIRQRANLLAKERPPEGFLSPFDPAFKAEYERNLFAVIEKTYGIPGGNPHTMNIMDMVETISENRLPRLWENYARGQVLWEDRERVKEYDSKSWNNWVKLINKDRGRIKADLQTRKTGAIKFYEHYMGKLDTKVKAAKANLVEQRRERMRQIEKAPQYRVSATGEITLHELDEATDKWIDTGKKQEKAETETLTIYDAKGKGRRVTVLKGEYAPPEGFTLEKPMREKPPSPIAKEKFAISKKITAGERRSELLENKRDKNFYEANVAVFNTTNSRNEVAYWGTEPGRIYGTNEVTKIIRLPASLIKKGLTPTLIQQQANNSGKTIAEVLKDLGLPR